MVLVGRGLGNAKCKNTSLLSTNINEKIFKPSVINHIEAIRICQKHNSNPFAVNEDKIIDDFNLTLDNLPYVPINYSELVSDEVKIITLEDSSCNIL